jgi:hypothetical protein
MVSGAVVRRTLRRHPFLAVEVALVGALALGAVATVAGVSVGGEWTLPGGLLAVLVGVRAVVTVAQWGPGGGASGGGEER